MLPNAYSHKSQLHVSASTPRCLRNKRHPYGTTPHLVRSLALSESFPIRLANKAIWYPVFCQDQRFGTQDSKKPQVTKSACGFCGYQTSRFAKGRVPNLGSCHEKVPNRPIPPRICLRRIPNRLSCPNDGEGVPNGGFLSEDVWLEPRPNEKDERRDARSSAVMPNGLCGCRLCGRWPSGACRLAGVLRRAGTLRLWPSTCARDNAREQPAGQHLANPRFAQTMHVL